MKSKKKTQLATKDENTFLSLGEGAIRDYKGISVKPTGDKYSMPVTNYIKDSASPTLDSFSLNMNLGIMVMTFSETIDASKLDFSEIKMLYDGTTFKVGGNPTVDDVTVTVTLNAADLNDLKTITQSATSAGFLSLASGQVFATDMAGNPVTISQNVAVSGFIADKTKPMIISSEYDAYNNLLTVTLNEKVKFSSFVPKNIIIQSDASGLGEKLKLTGGSVVESKDSHIFNVKLNKNDADSLKFSSKLAKSRINTFVKYDGEIIDMAGNKAKDLVIRGSTVEERAMISPSESTVLRKFICNNTKVSEINHNTITQYTPPETKHN